MYFCKKSLAAALLLAAPTTATAATVTYNGKSYEELYFNDAVEISAEAGKSVTRSFATQLFYKAPYDFGLNGTPAGWPAAYDAFYNQAIANGWNAFDVVTGDVNFSSINSSIQFNSPAEYATVGQRNYAFYDITFSPTTPSSAPEYGQLWGGYSIDSYALDSTGVATWEDSDAYYELIDFSFNALPASPSVTPVPIPGSAAFLALGLMGIAVAKRKKT